MPPEDRPDTRDGGAERRIVGWWTRNKLDLLGDYLSAFNIASKSAGATVYLDLFAGAAENEDRDTGEPVLGSARLALETRPAFSRLYLFELPTAAARLHSDLSALYPGAPFHVIPGDSNEQIQVALDDITANDLAWAPTFAFLDPYKLNVRWRALEALAAFKATRPYKVELFILCFSSTLPRVLTSASPPDAAGAEIATDFFGTEDWRTIHGLRASGEIAGIDALDEYVNLLRWRLERTLGYRHTLAFEVQNSRQPLYHLVFATDHPIGLKIMNDLYRRATRDHEAMRQQALARNRRARDEQAGLVPLFPDIYDPPEVEAVEYRYEPPWQPPGTEAGS